MGWYYLVRFGLDQNPNRTKTDRFLQVETEEKPKTNRSFLTNPNRVELCWFGTVLNFGSVRFQFYNFSLEIELLTQYQCLI